MAITLWKHPRGELLIDLRYWYLPFGFAWYSGFLVAGVFCVRAFLDLKPCGLGTNYDVKNN